MRLITVLLLALLASGCGKSVPDNAEIEVLLRDHVLSDGLGDLFVLEGFDRTNGFRESDNVYIVDVEYDLVFQKSFIEVVREIRENPTGPQYGMFGSKLLLAAMESNFGQFEVGDRIHKSEKLRLHRTEKGWLIADK